MLLKRFFLLSLSGLFLLFPAISRSQTYRVMSYNIRYANSHDGVNSWDERRECLVELVRGENPDVIGFQEVLHPQLDYLSAQLPDMAHVGVGREDGETQGEYAPIFFSTSRFELMESGTFWLSETPDTVSVGWDASLERICTFALLRERESQRYLWVFNAHFDHRGAEARERSAQLIMQKMSQKNSQQFPCLLTGDFNATPSSPPIVHIERSMSNALRFVTGGVQGTFNNFDTIQMPRHIIDYIFAKDVAIQSAKIIDATCPSGLYPSDHFPVFCVVTNP